MYAFIAILILSLAQSTFAGNKDFQEKVAAHLSEKAKALANGNTFVSKLPDVSQAKAESEGQCVVYLNSLPVDQLNGSLFIAESTYQNRGQLYRTSSPNPKVIDRFKAVAQDVTSTLYGRTISFEITGCQTKCEQERLNFSTFQNKCESEIKLAVTRVSEKTATAGDSYCEYFNSGRLSTGGCNNNMYLTPF